MKFTDKKLKWIFEPKEFTINDNEITIITEPNTDFWQRTYYGFQNDNAPSLLAEINDKYFSFTVKTEFDSKVRFDQCGVIIYQNSDNWFKASIEYENDKYQRLGSVVMNNGYSDWATIDIPSDNKSIYYRLSRRESDYYIEYSHDGENFTQMRIFHLFDGNETINVGIYACSPEKSSFVAKFKDMIFTECKWEEHK